MSLDIHATTVTPTMHTAVTRPSDPVESRSKSDTLDRELSTGLESQLASALGRIQQLEAELEICKAHAESISGSIETKLKEVEKFVLAGGALGGDTRDRIIRTLQEQLLIREEELSFYKSARLESDEDQRRDERLLISAIHTIALKYHEEMIRKFDADLDPPLHLQEEHEFPSNDEN